VTVSTEGKRSADVRAFLMKYYSGGSKTTKAAPQLSLFDTGVASESQGQSLHDPLHTITTKARFALVAVDGVDYEIADIGMRMLAPHELWRAQGFDNPDVTGLDGTQQIELCGNSVCPQVAEALVRANVRLDAMRGAA
jgi:DNA (cytosine-5)-methyltransferase 1